MTVIERSALFEHAFGLTPEDMPSGIIVTPFFPESYFQSDLDHSRYCQGALFNIRVLERKGDRIALLRLGKATYLAGDAVIMLAGASAKRLLFLNSCAFLKDTGVGSVVVPESALAGEGFSRYHDRSSCFADIIDKAPRVNPDRGLLGRLHGGLSTSFQAGRLFRGINFTTGSVTAENADMVETLRARNVISVDMELSKVLTAAREVGIKAASVLVVSDDLDKNRFYVGFTKRQRLSYNESCRVVSNVALDLLFSMSVERGDKL